MRDERELIRRAGQGDQEAFRQLVETYQAPAYRLALRMCGGDAALAEDAAQEAFLAAWRGLPRFRGDSRFSTWLYRLTTNAAIDCLRREKRHRDADDLDGVELPDGGDTPQEAAERTETQTAVRWRCRRCRMSIGRCCCCGICRRWITGRSPWRWTSARGR